MYVLLALIINISCSLGLLFSEQLPFPKKINFSDSSIINSFARKQLIGLVIALFAMLVTIFFKGTEFFAIGDLSKYPIALDWMGITSDQNWLDTGMTLCFSITLITVIFLMQILRKSRPLPKFQAKWIIWIFIFSAMNAFTEEIIYRFTVITLLDGIFAPVILCTISGIFFGIPHYRGMPNGLVGIVMASVLGFVLAKSVQETGGIAIAWSIHFLQDLPIITTLIWTNMKNHEHSEVIL